MTPTVGPLGTGTARLADIAAQAGVSEATVSRVLNGKPGVSAVTRQAVLAALDVIGYERPQRLRQRSDGLVGLVTPELDNPIFPAFAQAIEKALTQHGYTPVLCTQLPGGATEDEFTELLVERGVSGIVFVSGLHADVTADSDRYTRLIGQGVPIVLLNGYAADVAGAVHLSGRSGGGAAGRTASGGSGARADRSGGRSGPVRAGDPEDRGLSRGDGAVAGGRRGATS